MQTFQTINLYHYINNMDLIINFTQESQLSVSQLESVQEINQITFIVPIFLFFQNNFNLLYNYAAFLAQRPLIKTSILPIASEEETKVLEQHSVVLVRGTFDHLHLGHQVLLLKALYSASHKLIIEIKDDLILKNKQLKEIIQPVEIRKDNVKKFIQELKSQIQVKIQTITEIYGSAPYTKGIDAIAITEQSINSLNHINRLRKSNNGLKKVQMILSPLMSHAPDYLSQNKQKRMDSKLSSYNARKFLLAQNNFTLNQFMQYRAIWDSLVKEISSLCRVKDLDFIAAERWWQRVLYKHTGPFSGLNRKIKKSNKEIYLEMMRHNNSSTPNQHSLNEIAYNLALMFDGIQEEQKSLYAVTKSFWENLLKKKGKSKTCKKIRKMIVNEIKEYVQKAAPKKMAGAQIPTAKKINLTENVTAHADAKNNMTLRDFTDTTKTPQNLNISLNITIKKNISQQL